MYTDRKQKRLGRLLGAGILLVLLIAAAVAVFGGAGRELSDEGAAAIREAVRRSALQCYAVEGIYPPDLAYLEENYGLQVNTGDYYVTYDAFASNLPPTVIVTAKH